MKNIDELMKSLTDSNAFQKMIREQLLTVLKEAHRKEMTLEQVIVMIEEEL